MMIITLDHIIYSLNIILDISNIYRLFCELDDKNMKF